MPEYTIEEKLEIAEITSEILAKQIATSEERDDWAEIQNNARREAEQKFSRSTTTRDPPAEGWTRAAALGVFFKAPYERNDA